MRPQPVNATSGRNRFIAKTTRTLILTILTVTAQGCTWVKVSEEAAAIPILPAGRVSDCQRLGTVNTSVKAYIAGVGRNEKKVETELDNLARKEALKLNANSLVRLSIEKGQGEYVAYRCPG